MATLSCEGTWDGYEDCEDNYYSWPEDQDRLERERQLDDLSDRLYNEVQCGDITESQARVRFVRAQRVRG